jgi:hypothetical protein
MFCKEFCKSGAYKIKETDGKLQLFSAPGRKNLAKKESNQADFFSFLGGLG